MDQDYKSTAEKLSFELIDIQESLQCASNDINALLCSLVAQEVITPEQYEGRKNNWWEKKCSAAS